MSLGVATTQKYAICLIGGRWHRWDNFAEQWQELPARISAEPTRAALEYCAGFYGVRQRQIRIESAQP